MEEFLIESIKVGNLSIPQSEYLDFHIESIKNGQARELFQNWLERKVGEEYHSDRVITFNDIKELEAIFDMDFSDAKRIFKETRGDMEW